MDHLLSQKISRIENILEQQKVNSKELLTLPEAAIYLGVSKSYIYKLTSAQAIPFFRPANKLIYFKRSELDGWVYRNSFGKNTLTNKIR